MLPAFVARRNFLAQFSKPLSRVRIGTRQSRLIHGRNVSPCQRAGLGCNSVCLDPSSAHLRKRIGDLVDHQLDLPGNKVLHSGSCPAIGRELKVRQDYLHLACPVTPCRDLPSVRTPIRRMRVSCCARAAKLPLPHRAPR